MTKLDDDLTINNIPAGLFSDGLDVLTFLLDFDELEIRISPLHPFAKLVGASSSKLAETLERHRERCATHGVSERVYDRYGLEGDERTPHRVFHAQMRAALTSAQEEARTRRAQEIQRRETDAVANLVLATMTDGEPN